MLRAARSCLRCNRDGAQGILFQGIGQTLQFKKIAANGQPLKGKLETHRSSWNLLHPRRYLLDQEIPSHQYFAAEGFRIRKVADQGNQGRRDPRKRVLRFFFSRKADSA